jgi:outer membrane immunogenic protein
MRKFAMMAATAALISAPQLASAADLGGGSMKDVPPPIMVTNWTGFYGAVGIGFGAVVNDYKFNDEWFDPAGVLGWYNYDSWTTGGDGILGTIQLGYDYQFPASRWVIGAFVDYDWEHMSASRDLAAWPVGGLVDSHHWSHTLENQWNVGGRLGLLTSPETLVYLVLAYTQAQEKSGLDHWDDFAGTAWPGYSNTATLSGVTIGAGLETHLKDNWFLKLEYRFSQLSSDNVWDQWVSPGWFVGDSQHWWGEVDADIHTARIAVVYKFSKQGYVEPMK